jgi:hypothetical protein
MVLISKDRSGNDAVATKIAADERISGLFQENRIGQPVKTKSAYRKRFMTVRQLLL